MTVKFLSSEIRFSLSYSDETSYGSALTGQCDKFLREHCFPDALKLVAGIGLGQMVKRGSELIANAKKSSFGELFDSETLLKPEWLYPNSSMVRPKGLLVYGHDGTMIADIELSQPLFSDLAKLLGEWERGSNRPRNASARDLWDAFEDLGLLVENPEEPISLSEITFLGHASVVFQTSSARILIDPFFQPKSVAYPKEYQPLSCRELGSIDSVLVTHSHPDHFDLGSLLRVGADTPIVVPSVPRESVLAIDMRSRLEELGFTNVRTTAWWESLKIKDIVVTTLPFYGEQPSTCEVLHPEIRNEGNTYFLEANGFSAAFTVDSGKDIKGDLKAMAIDARRKGKTPTALFGTHRGFALYPIHYLFSSVARYLPFVPEHSWNLRQKMMCDSHDLIDAAELWGAKLLIPYAGGGAPWYWNFGLGPNLDQSRKFINEVDPPPSYLKKNVMNRSGARQGGHISSPIDVRILRPNHGLSYSGKSILTEQHQPWPYEDDV